jgi:MarR family transcriptional regulator, organic hydroperoxide resistance regulator
MPMDTLKHSPLFGLPADSLLRLDNQLCFALYSASLSMTKMYKPLLSQLNLTYPQYLVLLVLWEQDGVTVNSLGEKLFLDSGTLTPLLKRLEKQGLLLRQRAQEDERRVLLSLTDAGHALKQEAVKIPLQVACKTACSLPQLQALTQQLLTLRSALLN